MVRVLHIIWNLAGGGAERVVLDLCRAAPADVRCAVQPIAPGGALAGAFAGAGVTVLPPVRRGRRVGPGAVARLAAEARRHDLVHTHLWAGDTWGRLAGALARRPVVTTEHNTRPDAGWRGRVSVGMARLSRRVVCVSEAAAAEARSAGVPAPRIRVIPNGVDLSHHRARPLPAGAPPRVLFLGRLVPQKGPDVLLAALELLGDVPGLEVRVLGEGPLHPALARHPLVQRGTVRLLGWCPDPAEHLAWCSLVAMPSRWEGFGLVAVEAMAAGRPLVASRVDALPELIGDAGWLVPPDAPGALAGALRGALADPAALASRGGRGPARAARFGLASMVDAYARIWRGVLSAGPRA